MEFRSRVHRAGVRLPALRMLRFVLASLAIAMCTSQASAADDETPAWHLEQAKLIGRDGEQFENHLVKACNGGMGEACSLLGRLFESKKWWQRALEPSRRGCDLGWANACGRVAESLLEGRKSAQYGQEVAADPVQARSWLDRACNGGDGFYCRMLARTLREGIGGPADPKRARAVATKGCKDGTLEQSCGELGLILDEGIGGPVDYEGARLAYQRACRAFDPESCTAWGDMMEKGQGGPVDRTNAIAAYVRACTDQTAPHYEACNAVGLLLMQGSPSADEKRAAREAVGTGCNGGNSDSCVNFAILLYNGDGGPSDKVLARQVLKSACQSKNWGGCMRLGLMMYDGEGGPADQKAGRVILQAACDSGMQDSCELLAQRP